MLIYIRSIISVNVTMLSPGTQHNITLLCTQNVWIVAFKSVIYDFMWPLWQTPDRKHIIDSFNDIISDCVNTIWTLSSAYYSELF